MIGEYLINAMMEMGWTGNWGNMTKLLSDGSIAIQNGAEWDKDNDIVVSLYGPLYKTTHK